MDTIKLAIGIVKAAFTHPLSGSLVQVIDGHIVISELPKSQ
jgi:hypothetical protein